MSHLKFCYTIELAQHDLEKHWSGEFSYPLSEVFFYHCCERDSPSYGSSEQNEETGGFLSKTTTSYVSCKTEKCFHSRGGGAFYTRSLPGRSSKGKKKDYY